VLGSPFSGLSGHILTIKERSRMYSRLKNGCPQTEES
jgi:hypothetical protein